MIGDDVVVTIVEMRGEVARVGISAPRHVRVHREEIYREVANTNAESTTTAEKASELAAFVKTAATQGASSTSGTVPETPPASAVPAPSATSGAPAAPTRNPARCNGAPAAKKPMGVPKPGPPKARKN